MTGNSSLAGLGPADSTSDARELLLEMLRAEYRRARIARLRADLTMVEIEEFATSVKHGLVTPAQALGLLGPDPSLWFPANPAVEACQ